MEVKRGSNANANFPLTVHYRKKKMINTALKLQNLKPASNINNLIKM